MRDCISSEPLQRDIYLNVYRSDGNEGESFSVINGMRCTLRKNKIVTIMLFIFLKTYIAATQVVFWVHSIFWEMPIVKLLSAKCYQESIKLNLALHLACQSFLKNSLLSFQLWDSLLMQHVQRVREQSEKQEKVNVGCVFCVLIRRSSHRIPHIFAWRDKFSLNSRETTSIRAWYTL